MRKIVSLFLALLMLSVVCIPAFAAENDLSGEQQACVNFYPNVNVKTADGTEEYIRFMPGNARIDSNGDFTFYIHSDLMSGKFTAKDDNLTIKASAYIYNNNTGGVRKSTKVTFTISLYEYNKDEGSSLVGSFTGAADKKNHSDSFSVTNGHVYYMEIVIQGSLGGSEYVKGSGNISNI